MLNFELFPEFFKVNLLKRPNILQLLGKKPILIINLLIHGEIELCFRVFLVNLISLVILLRV
jgi:hypothetical protein